MVAEATESNRPYGPPSNVVALLHRLRERNLPDRVDTEYLRDTGIPEGTVTRTLFALRFLGLITGEGQPTDSLRSIGRSTDEEYRASLSGLVRDAYRDVFNVVDPAEDTQDRILNVFRRFTPASQRNRMVIFFLGICREAGIPTIEVPQKRRMATAQRPQARPPTRSRAVAPARSTDRAVPPTRLAGIDPALEGLVKSLPPAGTPMSEERRKQWINMAEATLAFLFPQEAASSPVEGGAEES